MVVRAKNEFNYGGIVKMNLGEVRPVDDYIAKKLIELNLVSEEVQSHKKIKVKKDVKLDKTDTNDSE